MCILTHAGAGMFERRQGISKASRFSLLEMVALDVSQPLPPAVFVFPSWPKEGCLANSLLYITCIILCVYIVCRMIKLAD